MPFFPVAINLFVELGGFVPRVGVKEHLLPIVDGDDSCEFMKKVATLLIEPREFAPEIGELIRHIVNDCPFLVV